MPDSPFHRAERRIPLAVWPLLLLIVLMLALSVTSIRLVSGLRAYAHAQGVWAVAQQRAHHALLAYVDRASPADLELFRREIAVPLADRRARLEMLADRPDAQRLRGALLEGRNPESDIPRLLFAFRLLRHHPQMIRAVETWGRADAIVLEMSGIGEQLRAAYASGVPPEEVRQQTIARIEALQEQLIVLMRRFGATTSDGAARIERLLFTVLPLFALALLVAGTAMYRVLDRRARRATLGLQELTRTLDFQASHDALTGLLNRERFEARLAASLRQRGSGEPDPVLLLIDLDQFKVVNDTCGRAAGDELVRRVAIRVAEAAGDDSVVARLGGDEFGVLLPSCTTGSALQIAGRIRQQVEDMRFCWQDMSFAVGASIGVLAMEADLTGVGDVMGAVDQACSLAKANGGNRIQVYRPEDRQIRRRRAELRWVERLIAALYGDGFTLHAQEIRPLARRGWGGVPAALRGIRRFELLLRLPEGDGRLVEPMAFIPAAERYGLMPRIDRWVIARACRELAALRAAEQRPPLCSINLSGVSAADPQLPEFIAEQLQEQGLDGSQLAFELPETVVAADLKSCTRLMLKLRELGCAVVLDDVGASLASFQCLRHLPIDQLKLNPAMVRRFRTDPVDHALVEAIQQVCGIMGISLIAEGVETEEMLASLTMIGVEFAQGNYLRRPVPIARMLATGAAGPVPESDPFSIANDS